MSSITMSAARPDPAAPPVRLPARDRRASAAGSGASPDPAATVARWPLDVEGALGGAWRGDPAIAIVRGSLVDYRSGRADRASLAWHDDISWFVPGPPPVGGRWSGPDGIFEYHALLTQLSSGTFRQHLVALEGSRGSIVDAYVRTTAMRDGRRLEMPSLVVFELAAGRVRCVTELPGDLAAWEAFWAE